MVSSDGQHKVDSTTRAFWHARQEAESWARVYEQIRATAVGEARADGLSYAQIAARWNLSKPMVTRILTKRTFSTDGGYPMMSEHWAHADDVRFDDTWIGAGNSRVASPAGQHRHGLISHDEYRSREARLDMAHKPIPVQLHDAVDAHPGLTARQLVPFMAVAVASIESVSFAHHAVAAKVAIATDGRYWPTVNADELQPGDRVPRHSDASPEQPGTFINESGEWVTIDTVEHADNGVCHIAFTFDDGLRSSWQHIPREDRYPVDRRVH